MAGKVIALTARSGAGKDFLASYLIEHHNYVRVSFSDQLKKIANKLFPWLEEDYLPEDKNIPLIHQNNPYGLTPRDIWKQLDTLRNIDPNIFVHGVASEIESITKQGKNVVITDVRKEVEYNLINSMGVDLFRIISPNEDYYEDEDIIDKFEVKDSFHNYRGVGLGRWDSFCVRHDVIGMQMVNMLPEMWKEQFNVDDLFDENITDKPTTFSRSIAIRTEVSELLESMSEHWVWWKPCKLSGEERKSKQLDEFADVLAFSMSYINSASKRIGIDRNELIDDVENSSVACELYGMDEPSFNELVLTLDKLATPIITLNVMEYIQNVIISINLFCSVTNYSRSEIHQAFLKKCEVNFQRVNSGYCDHGDKVGLEGGWNIELQTKEE